MNYSLIRSMDTTNGEGISVSLFVQGCHFHCNGCWNSDTWDFSNGKPWTEQRKQMVLELCDRSYIKNLSILGGEPLCLENRDDIELLLQEFKKNYPNKKVYLWTGYEYEHIREHFSSVLRYIDVLIDGKFDISQRDLALPLRGSKNQRVIDVKNTIKKGKVVLWGNAL